MTSQMSNEQLCIAALDGDTEARNALVENNLRFIKRTAYEMWSAQQELNAALGIEINEKECLKHPYHPHTLRHYTGALTDIRPAKTEFYF